MHQQHDIHVSQRDQTQSQFRDQCSVERTSQAHRKKTLVAVSETRGKKVDGDQGTIRIQQTDSRKRCRQRSIWNGETVTVGYDNGDDVETSRREALAESGRWARVEACHAIQCSVLIATLMQQTFATRRCGWNHWNWFSKA